MMSKPNEQPDDIVSMNFSLKRHERETINRRAKSAGFKAYRFLIELGVSGKLPKSKATKVGSSINNPQHQVGHHHTTVENEQDEE